MPLLLLQPPSWNDGSSSSMMMQVDDDDDSPATCTCTTTKSTTTTACRCAVLLAPDVPCPSPTSSSYLPAAAHQLTLHQLEQLEQERRPSHYYNDGETEHMNVDNSSNDSMNMNTSYYNNSYFSASTSTNSSGSGSPARLHGLEQKPPKPQRSVHFESPCRASTSIHVFERQYDDDEKSFLWYSKAELKEMVRQEKEMAFEYSQSCPAYLQQLCRIWSTPVQLTQTSVLQALIQPICLLSPQMRGLEKHLLKAMKQRRAIVLRKVLQAQQDIAYYHYHTNQDRAQRLREECEPLSRTSARFAKAMAEGDAMAVAQQQQQENLQQQQLPFYYYNTFNNSTTTTTPLYYFESPLFATNGMQFTPPGHDHKNHILVQPLPQRPSPQYQDQAEKLLPLPQHAAAMAWHCIG